jgi:hypothetical protein
MKNSALNSPMRRSKAVPRDSSVFPVINFDSTLVEHQAHDRIPLGIEGTKARCASVRLPAPLKRPTDPNLHRHPNRAKIGSPVARPKPARHGKMNPRAFSGPVFIAAGWGVISTSFPVGVFIILGGFLLLYLEIIFEPGLLNTSLFIQCVLMAICLFFVGWFFVSVIAAPARLDLEADVTSAPHFNGDALGGIKWTDKQIDLRVWIRNPTTVNYEKVDIVVDTNAYIEGVGQLQAIPTCTIGLSNGIEAHATLTDPSGTKHLVSPPVGSTLGVGYRVVCDKFPARSAIQLILATCLSQSCGFGLKFVGELKPNLGVGHTRPTIVTVKGAYTSVFRVRNEDATIDVGIR